MLDLRMQEAKSRRQQMSCQVNLTVVRSAAPLSQEAASLSGTSRHDFWSSDAPHVRINPTFHCLSRNNVVLDHATDLLVGFHLAPAYAPLAQNLLQQYGAMGLDHNAKTKAAVRLRFADFVEAWKKRSCRGMILRFFTGDALAFAYALQSQHQPGQAIPKFYCDAWTFETIDMQDLDELEAHIKPPDYFNVIDTSNLTDSLGAPNVLLSNSPLLKPDPMSTLYTEALLQLELSCDAMIQSLYVVTFRPFQCF